MQESDQRMNLESPGCSFTIMSIMDTNALAKSFAIRPAVVSHHTAPYPRLSFEQCMFLLQQRLPQPILLSPSSCWPFPGKQRLPQPFCLFLSQQRLPLPPACCLCHACNHV